MINLEDILDDAARYLSGRMDAEERSFFEALLDEYPHLKEDLALFQRVKAGFQWLEEHKEPPTNPKNGGTPPFFGCYSSSPASWLWECSFQPVKNFPERTPGPFVPPRPVSNRGRWLLNWGAPPLKTSQIEVLA